MNANEVIAGRANELAGRPRGGKEPVHPNDHVNLAQSSNDVIPTALHLAAVTQIDDLLLPSLEDLLSSFRTRQTAFDGVIKIGRTHLMDAVPLTVGQEISGWAHQIAAWRNRVIGTLDGLFELALGGTAVGTGLNTPPGFTGETIRRLAEATGQPFRRAHNRFAAQGSHDAMVATSGALRGLGGRGLLRLRRPGGTAARARARPDAPAGGASGRRRLTPRARERGPRRRGTPRQPGTTWPSSGCGGPTPGGFCGCSSASPRSGS